MIKPVNTIALADLRFDADIYPRQNVDEHHIKQMEHAMDGGIVLPHIIVDRKSKRIVDGVHRYHAALRRKLKRITCVLKDYKNESDLFREAVILNSGVGLKLGVDDTLKVLQIAERLSLKELDLAAMLHTSISHLRVVKNRYATLAETVKGIKGLRKVPLKGSVRHLAGEQITKEQSDALESAPGQSYLLHVRQLIAAIKYDLLPPENRHPILWQELAVLNQMLEKLLKVTT
jgi:ParB-like chromosome segregation protein Spo0J